MLELIESLPTGWLIVLILLVVGSGALFFTVFSEKKEKEYKGFMAYLYDFVHFKKLYVGLILKICYVALTVFITLYSFTLLNYGFEYFIKLLVLGNLSLRIAYELVLMLISIHENVVDINKKLKK